MPYTESLVAAAGFFPNRALLDVSGHGPGYSFQECSHLVSRPFRDQLDVSIRQIAHVPGDREAARDLLSSVAKPHSLDSAGVAHPLADGWVVVLQRLASLEPPSIFPQASVIKENGLLNPSVEPDGFNNPSYRRYGGKTEEPCSVYVTASPTVRNDNWVAVPNGACPVTFDSNCARAL